MHRRTVVALAEIMEEQLPVRLDLVRLRVHGFQLVRAPVRKLADERGQRVGERNRLLCEIDEDEALPDSERDRVQRPVLDVEPGDLGHRRHVAERAIERVRPCVVRTLDRRAERARALLAEPAAAMAAMVVERAHVAGTVAQHDHAFGVELEQEIAAGTFELRDMPDEQPVPVEDALALGRENFGRDEVLARQRALAE